MLQLDEWTHTFTTTLTINEDAACSICKTIENSIALNKAELEVPMLLLPVDLASFIAGDRNIHIESEIPPATTIKL